MGSALIPPSLPAPFLLRPPRQTHLQGLHEEQHIRLTLQKHFGRRTPLQALSHDLHHPATHRVPQLVDVALTPEIWHGAEDVCFDDEEPDEFLHQDWEG